jgi:hypothetical protein
MDPEISDGTIKKVHRKEVLKRALIYFVEEQGIFHDGYNYKGKIIEIERNGNIKIDFGIDNTNLMAKAKPVVDGKIMIFAKDFASKWQKKYEKSDYIFETDVDEFLDSLK